MNRKRSLSLFWEFILIYTMLVLLTCVLLGSVLTQVYLRSLHQRNQTMLQSQATHAVEDLDAQLEAMRTLSLKLSVQRIYTPDYFEKSKMREIELLNSLQQYQSYLSLADEFLLMYLNHTSQEISVFKSDGTKTDLNVYLSLYNLMEDEQLLSFFFEREERARLLILPSCLMIAYPVGSDAYSPDTSCTLVFVLDPTAFEDRIEFVSDIQRGTYILSYLGTPLTQCLPTATFVSAGSPASFSIKAYVPEVSLWKLLSSKRETVLFLSSIAVLMICIIILARRCYRPIRSLVLKYAGDANRVVPNNEWAALDQVMEHLQTQSKILNSQAVISQGLLRNYTLLMLFNNVSAAHHLVDFEKVGLYFDNPLFFVLAIAPDNGQIVSPGNMEVIAASMDDVAEDEGVLYAIECDPNTHTMAILCNVETPEHMEVIQQRVRTFLNCQSVHFILGTGTLVNSMSGISSSYLAALGRLNENRQFTSDAKPPVDNDHPEISLLLRQMLEKIERSDCQGALLDLDAYIEHQGNCESELMRRYNLFNVKCAIQQLCEKMNYKLSSEQMSMLLTISDVHSVHYALLQLIPSMCAHAQSLSSRAVVSASNLVMEYLHTHFCEYDISSQSIAEAVGIGINRTIAIIKEATGQSCKSYLIQLRLERAKTLLLESDAPVSDICAKVGYGSVSHFIKVFKTATGLTPDAFRRVKES